MSKLQKIRQAASDGRGVGTVKPPTFEIDERGCWLWTGRLTPRAYGMWGIMLAHRRMYLGLRGEVPEGLELDHLCRVPRCVNPWHMDAVTHLENVQRGAASETMTSRNAARTECANGHTYAPGTYRIVNGGRKCRICSLACNWRKRGVRIGLCDGCGLTSTVRTSGICFPCYAARCSVRIES